MKTRSRIALGVLAVVVLAAVLIVGVLDLRFGVLRSAPQISYTTVAPENSRVQLVLRPLLAKDYIIQQAKKSGQLPDWVDLEKFLPYEAAFLFGINHLMGDGSVTVFVNEQRLGPVIAKHVNQTGGYKRNTAINWSSDGMVRAQRGVLRLDGTVLVRPDTLRKLKADWGSVGALAPLTIEGKHLVEAVLDNRDGGAYAFLSVAQTGNGNDAEFERWAKLLDDILTIRLTADLTPTRDIALQMTMECKPESEGGSPGSTSFLLKVLVEALRTNLGQTYNLDIKGETELKGATIVGDYTLSDADRLMALYGLGG